MAQGLRDYFTVELQKPSGQPLASIEWEQQRWFVGEPDQEFVVSVSMVNCTTKTYRVSLLIDGQNAGYTFIFKGTHSSCKATFQGWLQQTGVVSGPCSTTYRAFKMSSCRPGDTAATVNKVDDITAGRIEVLLDEVLNTGQQQPYVQVKAAAPNSTAQDKKLPEGKKWFLAPGLKAEAGSMQASTTNWNTCIYAKVGALPSIKVRYDSSEALFLRKALNPRFAPHRAILRQSTNPAISAMGAEPVRDSGAPDEATSRPVAAAAGIKREGAGVKGTCSQGDADGDDIAPPRSATAAERVDLTEEPVRPMMVGGRRVAADEFAVCDLCDSDGEEAAAPKWQVKKKQKIDIEL